MKDILLENLLSYRHPIRPQVTRPLVLRRIEMSLFAIISFCIFWKAGDLLNFPPDGGFSASLLQNGGVLVLLAILILLVAVTALFSLWLGRVASDAPLACAVVGLAALSLRGGRMHDTLIAADGRGIYLTMTVELILLLVGIAASKAVSAAIMGHRYVPEPQVPDVSKGPTLLAQSLASIGLHAAVTVLLMEFFVRSDAKAQVMAGIFIASLIASLVANSSKPLPFSIACWTGPFIAAVVGYLVTFAATTPGLLSIGLAGGYAAPLARGLPLDYAALGTAGSIVGFWWAREFAAPDEEEQPLIQASPTPLAGATV